ADSVSLRLVFGAFVELSRRAIPARLSQGEASVGHRAAPQVLSRAVVSKHIKELEAAGLIGRRKTAQYSYCSLVAGPFKDLQGWLDAYRSFWDDNLDQFEAYLAELQRGGPDRKH